MDLKVTVETRGYKMPFRIHGHVRESIDLVTVMLIDQGACGRGESSGVRYLGETADTIVAQIEAVRSQLEKVVDRRQLQSILPPGGARNAVDCAMWDLEAKIAGQPAWRLAGLEKMRPVPTVFTCGVDEPAAMARFARSYSGAKFIKLKLTGDGLDAARIEAVRQACPGVRLTVDANEGLTPKLLDELFPSLQDSAVEFLEQPFPRGRDSWLDGISSPVPIYADESVQSCADLDAAKERYKGINIKLDKSGGLTEALKMVTLAKGLGLAVTVGNMGASSMSMAPSCIVAQFCDIVDLDGPLFLTSDWSPPVRYQDGEIISNDDLWGGTLPNTPSKDLP